MKLFDRYVVRQFVVTFVFALGALTTIFIIIDLFERLDKFIDNKTPLEVAVRYYFYFLPQVFELLVPVGLMLAGLFSVGRLSNNNEITAMRSAGQSPVRMLMPILTVAALMSLGQIYFNGWIVPRAATARFDIEREFLSGDDVRGSLNDLYFRESPSLNISIHRYDGPRRTALGVTIEEFGSAYSPRQRWRIDADTMQWDSVSSTWIIRSSKKRTFFADHVKIENIDGMQAPFTIRHDQIMRLRLNPEELSFTEMQDFINTMNKGGKDTRRQAIDLSGQWAFPFVNFIVVLISVPFASVRRRGGMAINIAAAMVLAITYIAFTKISQSFGVTLDLPVDVVGWGANGVFFLVGLFVLLRSRS